MSTSEDENKDDTLQPDFENEDVAKKALQQAQERQNEAKSPAPENFESTGARDFELEEGYPLDKQEALGHFSITNDSIGVVQFYKPSGLTGNQMLETIQNMEQEGRSINTMCQFAWHTLERWSLADEYDYEYWQKHISLADSIKLLRRVALGGNLNLE
jgi:hypothetical protein